MPELPEVETLRRGLEREALGRRITGVIIGNPKTLRGQSEASFRDRAIGRIVRRVDRRGKYLLMPLAATAPDTPSVSLCIHLKMRGQLLLEDGGAPAGRYHCTTLALDDGRAIRFYDMWAWGEMRALTAKEIGSIAALSGMGAEPLDPSWGGGALAAALAKRKGPIKPALLDQRVVAGVGNIYADESLFRAGVHPERSAATLSLAEVDRLAGAIRAILREAVASGGTTSDNYVDADGLPGRYTPRVYERGGAPCHGCGSALRRIRLGGRGTVFCPRCQS